MKTYDEFYDSNKWREKKEHILRRDKYQCQISKRFGKMVSAQLVHHIFPLREFPKYAFANWNLISLSWKEHNRLHDRTSDELTEAGRQLLIRTARNNGIAVPEKYTRPVKRGHGNGRPRTI